MGDDYVRQNLIKIKLLKGIPHLKGNFFLSKDHTYNQRLALKTSRIAFVAEEADGDAVRIGFPHLGDLGHSNLPGVLQDIENY